MNVRQLIVISPPTSEVPNYTAYAPEVPGCVATGDSYEDVLAGMLEALEAHLQGMVEDSEELPFSFGEGAEAQFVEINVQP